jgi:dephospho-CoA kinase
VTAPLELCLDRAKQFKNQSRAHAMDRIRSQIPQDEKAKRSDYILENDSGLDELYDAVNKLHTWIMHKTID